MTIHPFMPAEGETVILLPEAMRELRKGGVAIEDADNELDWRNPSLDGQERSHPLPVRFAWRCEDAPENAVFHVSLSTSPDFSNELPVTCDGCEAEADNLFIGMRYYWKVTSDGVESPVFSFMTDAQAPRLIRSGGMTNVRDIGGWTNVYGQTIRQGLLYRGSEMDTHHTITEQGLHDMLDTLGIRTDIDVRGEAVGRISESPLGPSVRWELIPVCAYGEYFLEKENETSRRLFSMLADESAYPLYLHCWGGADRTGTVVLLLSGLLGMDDESLMQDYELTSFAPWGKRSRTSDLFVSLLDALNRFGTADEPLRVKSERYLRHVGVTEEEIASIRRIFLG